ncbi:heat shock factor-binding protein 1-like isoform X1 [Gossypium australe]|uniref:Heat shock factor-binding protein 1-like isoform X1 n=1 Tax=Gossypium australe TaxID=47621 RepID=A0A5B6V224_9ROSI|nr:heat shock factor-binding protein 1-like isoform X1 [Gossypium australe]
MGNRINELEQSINDLKAEMGVEGTSSPLDPSKQKSDEAKQDEGLDVYGAGSSFTSQAKIATDSSAYDKLGYNSTSLEEIT